MSDESLERWGDVEAALTYWAKKSRWRACLMRGDSKCEKPPEIVGSFEGISPTVEHALW